MLHMQHSIANIWLAYIYTYMQAYIYVYIYTYLLLFIELFGAMVCNLLRTVQKLLEPVCAYVQFDVAHELFGVRGAATCTHSYSSIEPPSKSVNDLLRHCANRLLGLRIHQAHEPMFIRGHTQEPGALEVIHKSVT